MNPPNAQLLLEMLRQQGNPLANLPIGGPGMTGPPSVATPGPGVNTESSGMLAPAGATPGGPGTAVGAGASTPRNPAIISDPNDIQIMHAQIMKQLTAPVEVGAPPEAPNFPAPPTMAPMPGGVRGRMVAGLSGIAGIPNPLEVQRRQQFQDALQQYQAQVSPLQQSYQDRLKAYAEQQQARTQAAQAQRYGAMAASYMAPYFGISRSGTGGAPKVSNVIKFNQGMPVSVTDPQSGQSYPIDPSDKTLAQIPDHLKPMVVAAQRGHQAWYQEQRRLIQTRGEAFRLNTMYPVLDAEDGMAPIYARGYEILNNPGRYNAGSLGQMAMSRQNILMDIGDLSKVVRADFHALNPQEEFTADQRAMIASALSAPAGLVEQYLQSFPRMGMTQHQQKLATDLIQLKENAMALRGVIPGGTTETMRAAVANTLPGAGTPSIPYSDIQLDALDGQIARLSRGVPKVAMRQPGAGSPQAGEGTAPPNPVRGPVASQEKLNIQAQTAPPGIRQQAGLEQPVYRQGQLVGYTKDGKTISRLPNPGER